MTAQVNPREHQSVTSCAPGAALPRLMSMEKLILLAALLTLIVTASKPWFTPARGQ
jgi:hypothetical protein